ncbi:MAG TPA: hypothetical protein VGN69_09465 [Solirubrobacteraceae bacterium]|nr:hypothetical protein [Solirubrobacteraceae bacterium]
MAIPPSSSATNSASVTIAVGPLVRPVLSRVLGMMAARAQCPVDRLDEALLVADALAAHAVRHVPNGRLAVGITAVHQSLTLNVGPLQENGAQAVLAEATLPGVGNVLERIADEVSVTEGADGESLLIRICF